MRGADVPQATIERIVTVVRAVASGATSTSEVAQGIGASSRHAGYGLSAAKALGLVKDEDGLKATDLGAEVAAASAGSAAEANALRRAIDQSEMVRHLAPGLLETVPPSKASVTSRMLRGTGLSHETAEHRAAMLLAWRRRLGITGPTRNDAASRGMWRRVELRNYRSIEAVNIDLAPLTLVVGPNGSGKSNFADALVFARDVAVDASLAMETRGGLLGVRRWRPSKPTDVTVDIRAARSKRALDTDFVGHAFTIHSGKKGDWSFSRETLQNVIQGNQSFIVERTGSNLSGTVIHDKRPTTLTPTASAMVIARQYRGFIRSAALRNVRRYRVSPDEMRKPQLSSEKVRLEENGANIAVAIRSLKASDDDFRELLATMGRIVPGLLDLYPEQVGRYIALKFKQKQAEGEVAEFNATEMSEGALRALGIVVASLQMTPEELLIIEEPEVSLHVGAATLLFDVLKQASTRGAILVTTHSADLLDAAHGEQILVCDYRDGITNVGPMSNAQRTVVREGLFSLAELMRVEPLRIEGAPLQEFPEGNEA
jgi:type I restriction enzyme M protein